jgi:hypothetical protein
MQHSLEFVEHMFPGNKQIHETANAGNSNAGDSEKQQLVHMKQLRSFCSGMGGWHDGYRRWGMGSGGMSRTGECIG